MEESITRMSFTSSMIVSTRTSRPTFTDTYAASLAEALDNRKKHQIFETFGENIEDLTPTLLDDGSVDCRFLELSSYIQKRFKSVNDNFIIPHDVIKIKLLHAKSNLINSPNGFMNHLEEKSRLLTEKNLLFAAPFIKVNLNKTDEILLYENECFTVQRNTEQGEKVEEENKFYEYITAGKGRIRRMNTSETQTNYILFKTRGTTSQLSESKTNKTFVSNFYMFKTFKNVEFSHSFTVLDDLKLSKIMNLNRLNGDDHNDLFARPEFKIMSREILRLLAGNIYQNEQRRFRNMNMSYDMPMDYEFKYRLRLLFGFKAQTTERLRRSVADIVFCPGNGDIVAVAYGIYSFEAMHVPENGYCCVWNIKNPDNPERIFHYNKPVVSVKFSRFLPQLLAIGLYDGSVEVRDISTELPVASSQRNYNSTCDPVVAIEWISQGNTSGAGNREIDPLLALSQDGTVTRYKIINSPHLLAFKQIRLDRVEGSPEGICVERDWNQTRANRSPLGIDIVRHPQNHDIYFVLTDEGCLYKCSINNPHQHLEILQVHCGAVNVMDFSPWSPKLFLTTGDDWCIRIWIEGILIPLITLRHEIGPIHCAAWSKTHSTIIVSNSRTAVNIWDLRRSILKPVSSTTVDKSHNTLFKFTRCGRSMAIGNERGQVLMLSFEDMPFSAHFQYEELELSLFRAISTHPELTTELRSIGYFGYHKNRKYRLHHCT